MNDVTLAIVAGGRGTRMGAPKGGLQIGGKPILHYLLDRINWGGPAMLVTAPGIDAPAGSERCDQHVQDPVAGVGPLRGVLTALRNATTPIVVVAAVDMPLIRTEHLTFVADQVIRRTELMGVLLSRDGETGRQIEPFPSGYRCPQACAVIEAQLAGQRRAVRSLLENPEFVSVDAPRQWPASTWANLNTPGDLRRLQAGLEF